MFVFDEQHQKYVVLAPNDEDALAGVTAGVRVFQDVEQVAALDVEDDVLEPDGALRPELRVLASSQSKYFTAISVAQCVLDRHTLASTSVCPPVCPNPVR